MKNLIFFIVSASIFIGCAKLPEKTDAEELVSEIEAKACGNGIVEDWEECDFKGAESCSRYESEDIGPARCQNCKLDLSECKIKELCDTYFCNSNGICKEIKYLDYEIYCECVNDRTGTNCDKCHDGFYIKDDLCITDNCSLMKCFDYEKCDNSSGVAVCVCISDTQDSNDCSKCLSGFAWDASSPKKCINKKRVECKIPQNISEYAEVIYSIHDIYYSENTGWDPIPICEWKCKEGSINTGSSCKSTFIKQFFVRLKPLGFDSNNHLIAIDDHGIYSISNYQIETIKTLSRIFYEGVIGNDGNYYLRSLNGVSIFFTSKNDLIYIHAQHDTNLDNMSVLKKYISFGNSYLDFPELKLIKKDYVDTANISDENGNTLTVYSDGSIIFSDENWNNIWLTGFQNYFFGRFPVLGSDNIAYVPCCNRNSQKPGFLKINLLNPDENEEIVVESESEYSCYDRAPNIILGENGKKYVSYGLFIQIYDKNDKLISDTSKISTNRFFANLTPVITDNEILYFQSDSQVYCTNGDGELLWKSDGGGRMIHNNGILYVFGFSKLYLFYAPGNISGDWPQMKHDARLSNSLLENKFVDPPSAPVALTPEDSAVFNTNSVTFSWEIDSSDPNIKYTLLLRYSKGYDEVYAGPEIGLTTATVNDLSTGNYEWRIVSKDENGSLNVSDKRTFTVE